MGQLKYSIRSLELYAPWVRNIYIVTNGQVRFSNIAFNNSGEFWRSITEFQVPDWLNLENPRIRVVSHNEIFNDLSDLPTFNSNAIEMHLHHIKNIRIRSLFKNFDFYWQSRIHWLAPIGPRTMLFCPRTEPNQDHKNFKYCTNYL